MWNFSDRSEKRSVYHVNNVTNKEQFVGPRSRVTEADATSVKGAGRTTVEFCRGSSTTWTYRIDGGKGTSVEVQVAVQVDPEEWVLLYLTELCGIPPTGEFECALVATPSSQAPSSQAPIDVELLVAKPTPTDVHAAVEQPEDAFCLAFAMPFPCDLYDIRCTDGGRQVSLDRLLSKWKSDLEMVNTPAAPDYKVGETVEVGTQRLVVKEGRSNIATIQPRQTYKQFIHRHVKSELRAYVDTLETQGMTPLGDTVTNLFSGNTDKAYVKAIRTFVVALEEAITKAERNNKELGVASGSPDCVETLPSLPLIATTRAVPAIENVGWATYASAELEGLIKACTESLETSKGQLSPPYDGLRVQRGHSNPGRARQVTWAIPPPGGNIPFDQLCPNTNTFSGLAPASVLHAEVYMTTFDGVGHEITRRRLAKQRVVAAHNRSPIELSGVSNSPLAAAAAASFAEMCIFNVNAAIAQLKPHQHPLAAFVVNAIQEVRRRCTVVASLLARCLRVAHDDGATPWASLAYRQAFPTDEEPLYLATASGAMMRIAIRQLPAAQTGKLRAISWDEVCSTQVDLLATALKKIASSQCKIHPVRLPFVSVQSMWISMNSSEELSATDRPRGHLRPNVPLEALQMALQRMTMGGDEKPPPERNRASLGMAAQLDSLRSALARTLTADSGDIATSIYAAHAGILGIPIRVLKALVQEGDAPDPLQWQYRQPSGPVHGDGLPRTLEVAAWAMRRIECDTPACGHMLERLGGGSLLALKRPTATTGPHSYICSFGTRRHDVGNRCLWHDPSFSETPIHIPTLKAVIELVMSTVSQSQFQFLVRPADDRTQHYDILECRAWEEAQPSPLVLSVSVCNASSPTPQSGIGPATASAKLENPKDIIKSIDDLSKDERMPLPNAVDIEKLRTLMWNAERVMQAIFLAHAHSHTLRPGILVKGFDMIEVALAATMAYSTFHIKHMPLFGFTENPTQSAITFTNRLCTDLSDRLIRTVPLHEACLKYTLISAT